MATDIEDLIERLRVCTCRAPDCTAMREAADSLSTLRERNAELEKQLAER